MESTAMCIFSFPVESVSHTKIFGRVENDRQFLAYEMSYSTATDLAMIVPLPVAATDGSACRFINLADCPAFFHKIAQLCFRDPTCGGGAKPIPTSRLPVVEVGSFEASFVPTFAQFIDLDPRFRLPERVFTALDRYSDWGFAVFQLQRGRSAVHPFALEFHSRNPDSIFFPTTHVHDGEVPCEAKFDHWLFFQDNSLSDQAEQENWQTTPFFGQFTEVYEYEIHAAQGRLWEFLSTDTDFPESTLAELKPVLRQYIDGNCFFHWRGGRGNQSFNGDLFSGIAEISQGSQGVTSPSLCFIGARLEGMRENLDVVLSRIDRSQFPRLTRLDLDALKRITRFDLDALKRKFFASYGKGNQ